MAQHQEPLSSKLQRPTGGVTSSEFLQAQFASLDGMMARLNEGLELALHNCTLRLKPPIGWKRTSELKLVLGTRDGSSLPSVTISTLDRETLRGILKVLSEENAYEDVANTKARLRPLVICAVLQQATSARAEFESGLGVTPEQVSHQYALRYSRPRGTPPTVQFDIVFPNRTVAVRVPPNCMPVLGPPISTRGNDYLWNANVVTTTVEIPNSAQFSILEAAGGEVRTIFSGPNQNVSQLTDSVVTPYLHPKRMDGPIWLNLRDASHSNMVAAALQFAFGQALETLRAKVTAVVTRQVTPSRSRSWIQESAGTRPRDNPIDSFVSFTKETEASDLPPSVTIDDIHRCLEGWHHTGHGGGVGTKIFIFPALTAAAAGEPSLRRSVIFAFANRHVVLTVHEDESNQLNGLSAKVASGQVAFGEGQNSHALLVQMAVHGIEDAQRAVRNFSGNLRTFIREKGKIVPSKADEDLHASLEEQVRDAQEALRPLAQVYEVLGGKEALFGAEPRADLLSQAKQTLSAVLADLEEIREDLGGLADKWKKNCDDHNNAVRASATKATVAAGKVWAKLNSALTLAGPTTVLASVMQNYPEVSTNTKTVLFTLTFGVSAYFAWWLYRRHLRRVDGQSQTNSGSGAGASEQI